MELLSTPSSQAPSWEEQASGPTHFANRPPTSAAELVQRMLATRDRQQAVARALTTSRTQPHSK